MIFELKCQSWGFPVPIVTRATGPCIGRIKWKRGFPGMCHEMLMQIMGVAKVMLITNGNHWLRHL